MNELSVLTAPIKRRKYSPDFKRKIIAACNDPGISVAIVARDYGLNANLIHNWIRKAKANKLPAANPAFVALPLNTAQASRSSQSSGTEECLRLEIPYRQQSVRVSWPVSQSDRCLALLRELLQ